MTVQERLQNIEQTIQNACDNARRNREDVNLIAVTKYVSVETTQAAIDAGIVHIGENRIEGLQSKQENIKTDHIKWHFIGTLQSRKVKEIINNIDYLHSLDRLSLAKEINKRAQEPVKCFIQVNVSGEESKHGLVPDDVMTFVQKLKDYPKISVVGLMTMAPYIEDETRIRTIFRDLKELQLSVQKLELPFAPCCELSMGMSNDYHLAVEEGATFIRIGTALVGKEM